MNSYRLTPQARTGLGNILDYVERTFGVGIAEEVLARLDAAFEILARRPKLGRVRPDLTDDERIRFWSVGPSLIAYRRVGDTVEILMVERGERDWERLLGDAP